MLYASMCVTDLRRNQVRAYYTFEKREKESIDVVFDNLCLEGLHIGYMTPFYLRRVNVYTGGLKIVYLLNIISVGRQYESN